MLNKKGAQKAETTLGPMVLLRLLEGEATPRMWGSLRCWGSHAESQLCPPTFIKHPVCALRHLKDTSVMATAFGIQFVSGKNLVVCMAASGPLRLRPIRR